jgi:hypothetical protein
MSEPSTDVVPDAVRAAVLPLAAEVLGTLDAATVPASLAAVRRFAPRRRAAAGAGPLWLAVERDDSFRARVARAWSHAHPGLAADLLADPPGPAAPEDRLALAVGAVLLRPDGWVARVSALDPREGAPDDEPAVADAAVDLRPVPDDTHRADRAEAEVRRLAARLAAETERADAAEAELATLRKDARRLRADADRARAEARKAAEHAAGVAEAAERVHAETARVRAQADDDRRRADDLARTARQDASALRELAEVRVRLLLDTVVEAGAALRTELALPRRPGCPPTWWRRRRPTRRRVRARPRAAAARTTPRCSTTCCGCRGRTWWSTATTSRSSRGRTSRSPSSAAGCPSASRPWRGARVPR